MAFEDGQIVERSADGRTAVWGTVTRWEPPRAVAFSWHPGQPAQPASHVEITFAARAGQTLVTLVHTGWDAFADPAAARAEYDQGWPMVLDRHRKHAAQAHGATTGDSAAGDGGADGGKDDTWVVLLHRPGPTAPATGPLFEDPAVRRARGVPDPDARGGISRGGRPDAGPAGMAFGCRRGPTGRAVCSLGPSRPSGPIAARSDWPWHHHR